MTRYTPMMEQYLEIKKEQPDAILFFRLGDFYEMFFEDAVLASRELDIVLTGREGGGEERIPMCGVPYHSVEGYLARLVSRGYKVAICEQMEDPAQAKGIVRREVTRVVTPGTILEAEMLDEARNNYLAALTGDEELAAVAYIDISTAEFRVCELPGEAALTRAQDEIMRLAPAEILLEKEHSLLEGDEPPWWAGKALINDIASYRLNLEQARRSLLQHFAVDSLDGFGLRGYTEGIRAAAAIIRFLQQTNPTALQHLFSLRVYRLGSWLQMDAATRRNLELTATLRDNRREGSLLGVLDCCCTAMGKRTLRKWIEQPLLDIEEINRRLDAVEEMKKDLLLRSRLRECLRGVYDLERLAAKIGAGIATPRDLLALQYSLQGVEKIAANLQACHSTLLHQGAAMDTLPDVRDYIAATIAEDAPLTVREGGIIREGYNQQVDELRSLSTRGAEWLIEYESREKQRTGMKYLKVGFNKVFGYYIEVSKSNVHLVPADYIRKQTLVNTERYISEELKNYEEKILGAREKLFSLEYDEFVTIRAQLGSELSRIQATAAQVASLDVLGCLAEKAFLNNYIRPAVDRERGIDIKGGRHPVVEHFLENTRFVPNDLHLDGDSACFAIITGPNMGGKSTFLRQNALLVLLAQMGSFIPAEKARIGLVDRIFTRVGAADDLAQGQSTFMVEMVEVANILHNATASSLIILDEIGRGTSTYDGLSIAQAVSEYIYTRVGAKTLFATHYHELTALSEEFSGIFNLSVSVNESGDSVIFLKRVLPGKADKSYGVHVAALAGAPPAVVKRAQEILTQLEASFQSPPVTDLVQPGLFAEKSWLEQELESLDPDLLSPREALQLLYKWKSLKRG